MERVVLYGARTEINGKQIWAQFKNIIMAASDHSGKASLWTSGKLETQKKSLNCHLSDILWGGVGSPRCKSERCVGASQIHPEATPTASMHESSPSPQDGPQARNHMGYIKVFGGCLKREN